MLGVRFGIAVSFLALAACAIVTVVWLVFRSIQTLVEPGETEAEVAVAPTAAEDRKRAALKALKDLQYERSIGNVSEDDYGQLLARYREEAKQAMRAVDAERADRREEAERLAKRAVDKALGNEDLEPDVEPKPEPPPKKKAEKGRRRREDTPPEAPISRRSLKSSGPVECTTCETKNDGDARYCKKCGTELVLEEGEA